MMNFTINNALIVYKNSINTYKYNALLNITYMVDLLLRCLLHITMNEIYIKIYTLIILGKYNER
jgi:hypothetical protein